ncbi:hypothetical protein GCM10010252_77400 [Streptomyces aureoverticillatus]|nr:hypothetical protein GCM10010252_77400 [Streptomyces aureoverticillatus]
MSSSAIRAWGWGGPLRSSVGTRRRPSAGRGVEGAAEYPSGDAQLGGDGGSGSVTARRGARIDDPHESEEYLDELADEDDAEPCYACHGREVTYVQGYTTDDTGEPADVVVTRTPCGCTADRARPITGEPAEAST